MSAPAQRRVPRWRIVAGIAILAILTLICLRLAPLYFRNQELQSYVSDLTQRVGNQTVADDALRLRVLQKAQDLSLPVTAGNVHIDRSEGLRITVRYMVRVDLPFYTVNLHFYPGAGSQ